MIDLDTFIISDTHFRHKNIIKYCGRPMNHDMIMQFNWNHTVGHNDTILHLGDVATWYGDTTEAVDIIASLHGKKLLIMGNHDKLGASWYEDLGFEIIEPQTIKFPKVGTVRFSHYPETENLNWQVNLHGHIHNNGYPPDADPKKDYRNVSVEVMDYEPVRLRDVLYNGRFASHKELGFDTEKLRKQRR
jgi:calcineurin-like phosphoesterase family protein